MKILKGEPSHRHRFCDEEIELLDKIFIGNEDRQTGFNRRMFEEDFSRLFHYRNQRSQNLFIVDSTDSNLVETLLGDVKVRYSPHSVGEAIRGLVEDIAQKLIGYGKAYYFLYNNKEGEENPVSLFSSRNIVSLFGAYIQWLPKCRARHWDKEDEEHPRELRVLDPDKIMKFNMPASMKRMLSAQNKILAMLDKHRFEAANFHPPATYEDPNPTTNFDFSIWNHMQDRALYRATRETGWNGRKFDSSKRSDFFDCHRLIRFRRNQLLLRDSILSQLSAELSKVGKKYNPEFLVEISAGDELPAVSHLNQLEKRLEHEDVGFKEIIDYYFQR